MKIRIEWRKGEQSLVKPPLLIYDAFHLISNQQIQIVMINKKLSDLFLRKESNKKEQPKQNIYFDENFFHCRLVNTGINTELIRVQTQLKENGQPLDQIKCKWFIKNSHDFREIQQVTSQYYQPCLDDVGSIICVQIQPFVEGKKYNGITIMKESEVLKIDQQLEEDLCKFLQRKQIKLDGRIDAIFSQNQKYELFQLPAQIKVEIVNSQILFYTNGKQFEVIKITSEYPNVQFIRKSFNSILLNFNERQSFKLSFFNNYNRDLFTLITRTVSAHSASINPQQISQETLQPIMVKKQLQSQVKVVSENNQIKQKSEEHILVKEEVQLVSSNLVNTNESQVIQVKQESKIEVQESVQQVKQKIEEPKQNNTILILKLDEQNKQLKIMKRQLDELKLNYNIEKQGKKNIEVQCDQYKKNIAQLKQQLQQAQSLNKRLSQVNEDNRFYKNELAILRKESKIAKQKIKQLQNSLDLKKKQQISEKAAKIVVIEQEKADLKNMRDRAVQAKEDAEAELQRLKHQFQNIQNENHQLKKKLQSLLNERNINQPKQVIQKPKLNQSDQKVLELQMKLKNLQMLLKYKSNQGESSSNFQILVNKLTQTISEKQLQLNEFKRINKNLLQQLKATKSKGN